MNENLKHISAGQRLTRRWIRQTSGFLRLPDGAWPSRVCVKDRYRRFCLRRFHIPVICKG